MQQALIDHLLGSPPVNGLAGTRIRPAMRGQNDNTPCVVVSLISSVPAYHLSGQSDLAESRVQIDCWGTNASEARGLARAVKVSLPKQPWSRSGIDFGGTFQIGERQSFEGDTPSARLHRVSLDFRVWHSNP